jgi:hypothetical protein
VKPGERIERSEKKWLPLLTVDFLVILHVEEWVEIKVAEKGNVGPEWDVYIGPPIARTHGLLNPPVVLILG